MVTPTPTPTSTSVGASTPSAIRARATSAISTVATHLPVLRQRPSGTSVYRMPMRIAVRKAIGTEGIAHPPQLARRSTPNGRGRRAMVMRATVTRLPSCTATHHTSRCRQRRRTSKAANRAK
jgi:hypothetical protein